MADLADLMPANKVVTGKKNFMTINLHNLKQVVAFMGACLLVAVLLAGCASKFPTFFSSADDRKIKQKEKIPKSEKNLTGHESLQPGPDVSQKDVLAKDAPQKDMLLQKDQGSSEQAQNKPKPDKEIEQDVVQKLFAPEKPPELEKADAVDLYATGEKIVSLDFRQEELRDVMKVFSVLTRRNIVVKESISEQEVTIYLSDISPLAGLEAICDQYELWYEIRPDYIKIMPLAGRIRMKKDKIAVIRFTDQSLCKVLRVFSRETGVNTVANENIKDKPINIFLKNVSPKTAIEVICKKHNLWYEENNNYIRLISAEDFGRELSLDCGIKTRIFNLKYASSPQVADAIGCVMGNRVEYNVPGQLKSYEHIKLPDIEEEEGKIEGAKTIEANVTQGIETGEFEENLTSRKLEVLLRKRLGLRLTAEDVRIINKEVGFALISVFLRNNCILASSTDSRILMEIANIIKQVDVPTPQVLIECKILKATLSDNFTSFFDMTFTDIGVHHDLDLKILPSTVLMPAGTPSTLLYEFISPGNYKFDLAMELHKKDGTVEITATPMIIAAQNAEAEFFTGFEEWPFVKGIRYQEVDESNVIGGAGKTRYYIDVDTTLEDVGTKLRITPQINEDETITLRLHIEESYPSEKAARVPFWNPEANSLSDYPVDVKETNHIHTIITVPRDYTLALGGLVHHEDRQEEEKVPVLGDLPLLGFFFRDMRVVKEKTETIFLLTPHLMMKPQEVRTISDRVLKQASRHSLLKEEKDLKKKEDLRQSD